MLEEIIRHGLQGALEKFGVFEDVEIELGKPRAREHGDLSTNVALALGPRLGRKPREFAKRWRATSGVRGIEIAGCANDVVQGRPVDIGHRNELQPAILAGRMDGDDVCLVQFAENFLLAQKSLPRVGRDTFRSNRLEGYTAVE